MTFQRFEWIAFGVMMIALVGMVLWKTIIKSNQRKRRDVLLRRKFQRKLDQQRNIGNRIFNELRGSVAQIGTPHFSVEKVDDPTGSKYGFTVLVRWVEDPSATVTRSKSIVVINVNCFRDEDPVCQKDIRVLLGDEPPWEHEDGTLRIFGVSEVGIRQLLDVVVPYVNDCANGEV